MQPICINSLLSRIAALTEVRENIELETALINILNDFLTSTNGGEKVSSTVIYHLKDAKKQLITLLSEDKNIVETDIPVPLKQAIIQCFTSGQVVQHQNTESSNIKLLPIINASNQIECVIAIDASLTDTHTDVTISLLLSIYQNFIALFNDNESDTLTGLLNRKTFELKINKLLTQMLSGANRKVDTPPQSYFLALFDIDHFKRINDNYGHLIGDEVLLIFAQLMQQAFRDTDLLFRFGGEEFVGIFECTGTADIKTILERFRQKVETYQFPRAGKITVSIGYTEILDFDTSSQLIDRADSALYFAKNNGRNRTEFYEQLIAAGSLQETRKEGDIEFF